MKQIVASPFLCIVTQLVFAQTLINSNDRHLRYMGRVKVNADSAWLLGQAPWLRLILKAPAYKSFAQGSTVGINWLKLIVDGQITARYKADSNKQWYTLVSGLPAGAHTLEPFKRTEWIFGSLVLLDNQGTQVPASLKASPAKKHRIEFYGNSITCSCAVFDTTGKDRAWQPYEDNHLSYTAITARHFNADYRHHLRGVVLVQGDQLVPADTSWNVWSLKMAAMRNSKWDFSLYDVVGHLFPERFMAVLCCSTVIWEFKTPVWYNCANACPDYH